MAATDITRNTRSMSFTLGWKERKAIRSVIKNGTYLRLREEWKLTSSRFYVQARTFDQVEDLEWLALMIKN